MTDIKARLETMRNKLEALGKEKSKIEGKHEQIMDNLKAQGINSLEEGQARVAELETQWKAAETKAEELLSKFEEDYKEFL